MLTAYGPGVDVCVTPSLSRACSLGTCRLKGVNELCPFFRVVTRERLTKRFDPPTQPHHMGFRNVPTFCRHEARAALISLRRGRLDTITFRARIERLTGGRPSRE